MEIDAIEYEQGLRPPRDLPLALLLVRLSYPHRLWELALMFGRSPGYLSVLFNTVAISLDARFGGIVAWHPCLTRARIKHYARMLNMRADGGGVVWGWVDGTFQGTCRPNTYIQRQFYSGYKKKHGLKWQGIVAPDGLIASLSGPWPGEVNDNRMLSESGVIDRIRMVKSSLNSSIQLLITSRNSAMKRRLISMEMGHIQTDTASFLASLAGI